VNDPQTMPVRSVGIVVVSGILGFAFGLAVVRLLR